MQSTPMLDCRPSRRTAWVPAPHIPTISVILLAAAACAAPGNDVQTTLPDFGVTRFTGNPLITFASSPRLDVCAPKYRPDYPDCPSINGPSVIRVPEWIENPLGRYYMYFANHVGDHIRLAYADSPTGPWTVHEPGTLRLDQVDDVFWDHIASPDVHVDDQRQRILMYFHAPLANQREPKNGSGRFRRRASFQTGRRRAWTLLLSRFRVARNATLRSPSWITTGWGELYEARRSIWGHFAASVRLSGT